MVTVAEIKKNRELRNSHMGFNRWLQILFIALKLTGEIDWSWWLVLIPELIALVVILIEEITIVYLENKS